MFFSGHQYSGLNDNGKSYVIMHEYKIIGLLFSPEHLRKIHVAKKSRVILNVVYDRKKIFIILIIEKIVLLTFDY